MAAGEFRFYVTEDGVHFRCQRGDSNTKNMLMIIGMCCSVLRTIDDETPGTPNNAALIQKIEDVLWFSTKGVPLS